MISQSTVVFTTAAEATTWTTHSVTLDAYAGETVYIGLRNNSNDKFLLLVDDVKVETELNIDAEMFFADTTTEYTVPSSASCSGGVVWLVPTAPAGFRSIASRRSTRPLFPKDVTSSPSRALTAMMSPRCR